MTASQTGETGEAQTASPASVLPTLPFDPIALVPPNAHHGADGSWPAVAAFNLGRYCGELLRQGWPAEKAHGTARGTTQGFLSVGGWLVRVELDVDTGTLFGIWESSLVQLSSAQVAALLSLIHRSRKRLAQRAARALPSDHERPGPEWFATQAAFLDELSATLRDGTLAPTYPVPTPPLEES